MAKDKPISDEEAECYWCTSGERGPAEKRLFRGKETWFHGSTLCGDQKHYGELIVTNTCGTCRYWKSLPMTEFKTGNCYWEPSVPNPDSKLWTDIYGLPRALKMSFYSTNMNDGVGCPCWKGKP